MASIAVVVRLCGAVGEEHRWHRTPKGNAVHVVMHQVVSWRLDVKIPERLPKQKLAGPKSIDGMLTADHCETDR